MINRIALAAASLAAALVLAAGLALAGFGPAAPAADAQASDPSTEQVVAATADAPAPTEQIQVDTVYLTPKATPEVIVTKVVRERPATATTRSSGGETENESGDD
jgi:hypothetical protein